MEYMTIKEASAKWGIGTRIITVYCTDGRIAGAVKRGNLWLIPENTAKPTDRRRKETQNEKANEFDFQSLYEKKELFAAVFKYSPYPMHICAPNGTMLLANDAYLRFAKIINPEKLYKKHNILANPNLERWGIKDFTERAFRGEAVHAYDVKVPYEEIIERLGDEKTQSVGSLYHDISAFPIHDSDGKLSYIVFIFITSREYQGKEEIIKGKEYIDSHWLEEFNIDKLAEAVYISKYRYARLFKQHTGMTPYCYYQEVKVEKIKEKLCDINLTIAQAFAKCGVDYNGSFTKVFKRKTGMTPSEYRAKMTKK
jgi:AraC family transcriptional regulator